MRPLICIFSLLLLSLPAQEADAGSAMFAQPQKVCRSLDSEGLRALGWRASKIVPGGDFCMTALIFFGPVGSVGLASNISLFVSGSSPDAVDAIRQQININNPATRREAFGHLERATQRLHQTFEMTVPAELKAAISAARPAEMSSTYGSVSFVYEGGNIDSYVVVLKRAP